MHLRAEYQGLLASLSQDDQTRIQSQNLGVGEGSQPKNQNPYRCRHHPDRGDLPQLPHTSGCNQGRSQR